MRRVLFRDKQILKRDTPARKKFAELSRIGILPLVKQELIDWMRDKDLRAEQVGKHLNVSAQTVRNWRVSGIPPRKQGQVREMIANWDQRPAALLGRIILSPTPAQFDHWNDAAMAAGQRISEWAVEGLDDLAKKHELGLKNRSKYPSAADERRFSSSLNEEPRAGTSVRHPADDTEAFGLLSPVA